MTRKNEPFSLCHSYIVSQGRKITRNLTANHQSKDLLFGGKNEKTGLNS